MLPLLKFTQNPGFIAVAIAKIAFDSKKTSTIRTLTSYHSAFFFSSVDESFPLADPQQPIMVKEEEPKQSPRDPKIQPRESNPIETGNGPSGNGLLFSPRFKSAAAMAGWDEESLLIASLVVEDTPEQDIKQKKRSVFRSKTPPTNSSRRKRRVQRKSPISIPVAVLDLDYEQTTKEERVKEKVEPQIVVGNEEKKTGEDDKMGESSGASFLSSKLPCLDKLRDELSCAICLDICFEPSTTPCGHSFCKKCLRSAADKCGKRCPKCRQLTSNGRSCTVNTVLWNTIQLLFPQEVEARKATGVLNSREEAGREIPEKAFHSSNSRNQSRRVSGRDVAVRRRVLLSQDEDEDDPAPLAIRLQMRETEHQNREQVSLTRPVRVSSGREIRAIRRVSSRDANPISRRVPIQDDDAALALRLQREEFMEAFRGTSDQSSTSLSSARANLRAMASRAANRGAATRFM